MRKVIIVLIVAIGLLYILSPLCFAGAATDNGNSTAVSPGYQSLNFGPLQSVSISGVVNRIQTLATDAYDDAAGIIVPVAKILMLISCFILIVGGVFGVQFLKRVGWGGLWTSIVGIFVFYGIPLIFGLAHAAAVKLTY